MTENLSKEFRTSGGLSGAICLLKICFPESIFEGFNEVNTLQIAGVSARS